MRIGYQRVSTTDQNTDRQLEGIEVDRMFTDYASGKDTNRPKLSDAMDFAREGDTLVVHSMDRLARNLVDLRSLVLDLTTKRVTVQFVKESLTFTGDDSPTNTLILNMLGAAAEFERSTILDRQKEGIAIAKTKGVYKGRKPTLSADQAADLKARKIAGESVTKLAEEFGISRQSVYRYAA